MPNKIYLDCTHTYNSGLNTGIQRVVKNIVSNITQVKEELGQDIIPIVFKNNKYFRFDTFPKINTNKNIIKKILKRMYIKVRLILSMILPKKKEILYSPVLNIYLSTLTDKILFSKSMKQEDEVILYAADTLIIMDAIWLHNDYEQLLKLKQNHIKIIAVVYDIIPLTHPEFCTIDLNLFLHDWYKKATQYIDGYMAISKTVKNEVYSYIRKNVDGSIHYNKFDCFYLGVNTFERTNVKNISKTLELIFKDENVYLTVSTIEPRKNHKYILDTFELLWKADIDATYVIIGKIGWDSELLIKRIKSHERYNKNLFLLTNVDDTELEYAYEHSKALIFASYAEGFGMPIIESQFYKLPVIASDIQIHREIGADHISYFDLSSRDSLFNIVKSQNIKPIHDFTWKNWTQSAIELISKSRNF